uniref:Uncharacterized protein TCIL3000_1_1050 n=1 Tax=Trypanosoma congolense (strain IL3000) TaxID=1068625 RepID=G0UIY7_TRYCI|nr:unnamed protein product [Trypanosoma congolense IL3000]
MSSRHVQSSSVSGRKRKKSVSDIINEQFGISDARRNSADEFDDFYGDGPMIDDYYEGNESGDENMDDNVDSRITPASKRHRAEDTSSRKKQEKRLRRRGPIDPSLSTGEYAATPVEVEAAMDDLFGALEMDEDDMSLDEGEGLQVNEKGKHRKAETEEEYIQWLEAQQKKRQRRRGAAGLTEEGDILQQIEALRSAQVELLQREQEGGSAADPEAKERVKAQEAIQHYVMLYSQLLRMRIKLQPVVTRAIAFPQYYALSDFIDNGDSQIREGTTAVVQSLRGVWGKFTPL